MERKIGDKVKVAEDNDNENYDILRDKVLIITDIATNTKQHRLYDEGLNGEPLYSFKTEDGEDVPYCLYEYKVESA